MLLRLSAVRPPRVHGGVGANWCSWLDGIGRCQFSTMREGELLGLRWQDVDLTLGVAAVQQTYYKL